MTDKPTDEIERRASEAWDDPISLPLHGKVSEDDFHAIFRAGHSAAKEEVESWKNNYYEAVKWRDKLEASHGELEMKHHGAESIIRGLEAESKGWQASAADCSEKLFNDNQELDALKKENAELKNEVRVLREHNKELDEWNFTHRVKVESLKAAEKELDEENTALKKENEELIFGAAEKINALKTAQKDLVEALEKIANDKVLNDLMERESFAKNYPSAYVGINWVLDKAKSTLERLRKGEG